MLFRISLCAAVMAAFLIRGETGVQPVSSAELPRVALVREDGVPVRSRPGTTSPVLTILVQQSQVEVLRVQGTWAHVRIWDSIPGWLPNADLFYGGPWKSVSHYRAPQVRQSIRAHAPARLTARAVAETRTTVYSAPGSTVVGSIAAGKPITVSGWRQDSSGKIWYQTGASSWVPGDAVVFTHSNPGSTRVGGKPVWAPIAGKGMWLTLGAFQKGDPNALATAARRNGISHLYLESAISPLGFHGMSFVGRTIEAAHRNHIAVLAWVYPYLYDTAADVKLTREVAAFRTASGERFDGIAADLEQNVRLWSVRAYSQLVRSYLGARYLLVGVPYPPQSAPDYPFAELARTYNVIAPMDYWHQTATATGLDYGHMPYGFQYARRYAADSVAAIRRVAGNVAIAPIGQTFDDFGRLEMGPNAPSADEIRGFLTGSKASGAIGASFFQWVTATDTEWHAIRDYRY